MSTELVKKAIREFLKSEQAEVLCVRGRWGVGKTFTWTKYLEEAHKDNIVSHDRYAYVSLFGLNSISDLKQAIFQNTVTKDSIGKGPSLSTWKAYGEQLIRKFAKPATGFLALVPWANPKEAAETIFPSLLAIRDQIICIDDLEIPICSCTFSGSIS